MPAKAGIQNYLKTLDSRLRGNDAKGRFKTFYETINIDGFVKSRIIPYIWIPASAGMTIKLLISNRYKIRHTREGGYPGNKVTFYVFIKLE